VVVTLLVVVSAGFFVMGFLDNLAISAGYLAVVALGIGYYAMRRLHLAASGYDMDAVLRTGASAEG
jgi:uncharacterized membrane protein YphA (DoxX/SURF4 family)